MYINYACIAYIHTPIYINIHACMYTGYVHSIVRTHRWEKTRAPYGIRMPKLGTEMALIMPLLEIQLALDDTRYSEKGH